MSHVDNIIHVLAICILGNCYKDQYKTGAARGVGSAGEEALENGKEREVIKTNFPTSRVIIWDIKSAAAISANVDAIKDINLDVRCNFGAIASRFAGLTLLRKN
jgi:hypothetical protein